MDPITLLITAVFAVAAAFGLLRGLRNGVLRQVVRCATTLAAILLSFIVTKILSDGILEVFGTEGLIEILVTLRNQGAISIDTFNVVELADYLSAVKWLVALPVSTLIMPIVFTLLFVILNSIAKIVFLIIRPIVPGPGVDPTSRLLGAALGAIEGLVVAAVVLLPIFSTFGVIDDSMDAIADTKIEQNVAFVNEYNELVGYVADSAIVRTVNLITDPITNGLATMNMDGEKVNLRKELGGVVSICFEASAIETVDGKLTDNGKSTLRSITGRVTDSHYLSGVVSTMLRDSSNLIEDGLANVDKDVDKTAFAFHGVAEVFINADRENIGVIFNTLLDALFYVSDQDLFKVFSNTENFGSEVSMLDENGNNKITVVTSILNGCEHTRPLVTTISKVMLSVVFNSYTSELGDIGVTYDDVKESFGQVVTVQRENYETDEEYKAAKQEALNQVFIDHGVDNADPEVLADICDYLDEKYPNLNSVDDEQFNDLIFSGISYYTEKKESGEIPEIPGIEDEIPEIEGEVPDVQDEIPESSEE